MYHLYQQLPMHPLLIEMLFQLLLLLDLLNPMQHLLNSKIYQHFLHPLVSRNHEHFHLPNLPHFVQHQQRPKLHLPFFVQKMQYHLRYLQYPMHHYYQQIDCYYFLHPIQPIDFPIQFYQVLLEYLNKLYCLLVAILVDFYFLIFLLVANGLNHLLVVVVLAYQVSIRLSQDHLLLL